MQNVLFHIFTVSIKQLKALKSLTISINIFVRFALNQASQTDLIMESFYLRQKKKESYREDKLRSQASLILRPFLASVFPGSRAGPLSHECPAQKPAVTPYCLHRNPHAETISLPW